MNKNPLSTKSLSFTIQIVEFSKQLSDKKEFIISKQLLRSGTAIGALIREANETEYWLEILKETKYIFEETHTQFYNSVIELIKLLVLSIKTVKTKMNLLRYSLFTNHFSLV